jgi:hypothetical protein
MGRQSFQPILGVIFTLRPLIRSLQAHNQLVLGSSPTSPTTQSHENPVSWSLWKNPRFAATFAQAGAESPVSAAADGRSQGQNAGRSLARANPFPADFIPQTETRSRGD